MSRVGARAAVADPAPYAPEILVSSRDDHEVPIIGGVVRLVAAARAAGWTAKATYARCRRGATYRVKDGELKRAGHELESVCVRLARDGGRSRGWAFWERESDRGRWAFSMGMVVLDGGDWMPHLGLRELLGVITHDA